MNDHRLGANIMAGHQCTDLKLDQVATAQFAADGQIEQRSVTHTALPIQEEPDCPNLSHLERSLGADLTTGVPCRPTSGGGVIL